MCLCVPDRQVLFWGFFVAFLISPIWSWHLKSWAVGFPPSTHPQDLAVCSVSRPAPPNPHAIQPDTITLIHCLLTQLGNNSSWPTRGLQGRAEGGGRNKSIPLEGQRQAAWSHSTLQRVVEATGNTCSHTKATHRAMQLNDGDSNAALPQSGHSMSGGHFMLRATFVNQVGPKDREGPWISQHSSVRSCVASGS